ncbi:FadR/GntR family transcriptional regulator [Consotaella aegiceratis]|uniref:FadR/GntR family transcriptional regulator n=1 Tax=Consotaella aegiceratis TaxID=3097961 RepID=UPI002F3E48DB
MGKTGVVNNERSLGAQVAESLARELLSGAYRPGDILPKEIELTERFGVSRASVRSGLQSLTACGMVRRLAGQGTIVQDVGEWNILDPVITRRLADQETPHPDLVRAIFSFRYAAEPLISAIAAKSASARDLLAMEEAFEGMTRAVEFGTLRWDRADFSEHDVDFHAAIYRATRNAIWAQLVHILRPAITLVVRQSNETADELRDSLGRHHRLMEAIRLRDPHGAFKAARSVMDRTAQDLHINPDSGIDGDAGNALLVLSEDLDAGTAKPPSHRDHEAETGPSPKQEERS